VKKEFHFLIYIVLAIFLFIGSNDDRLKKAQFLNNTIYFPLVNPIHKFNSLLDFKEKYKILKKEHAEQTIRVIKLENKLVEIENSKIKYETSNYNHLLTDIIGFKGDFKERCLIINKGKRNNIKLNYPVISNDGIVGKIIAVSHNYSIVLPLDHSIFKLGIMSKRTHLQGIMESDIFGNSYMTLIKPGSDIKVGDIIVTSQISSVFPKGFPVGKVVKLTENPADVFMSAKIQTFINPSELDQAVVLLYEKDESYEEELKNN
jgi:rod shape-determining protein MreC